MNISNTVKLGMLSVISAAIDPTTSGQKNYFYFTNDANVLLAKMPFDEVMTTTDPSLVFLLNSSDSLEGVVDVSGKVSKFYIPDKGNANTVVLSGRVGTPSEIGIDIVFNRVDWVRKNGISLTNVSIRLESVCLHQ